ncbi:amino acid permease [Calditrichota bacterium]
MITNNVVSTKNKLGFWMCTSLVVGNMIGSGIFLLPASLAKYGGISIVGWLVTSTGSVLLALVFAKLSRLIPKTGGPYIYSRIAFGEFAGFLVAWGYWLSIVAANAAIAVAFVSYLTIFWPILAHSNILAAVVALGSIWFLTYINSLGVRNAGIVQLITTLLKIVPLFGIAIFGIFYLDINNFIPFNLSDQSSVSAITATVALTLWAFLGLESGTVPADNVIEPERTIPRATVLGTVFTALIYILGTVSVMGIISPANLAHSTAPFADAATKIFDSWAGYIVGIGAIISCFGALNGWILLQGQIPLAASIDGIFPKFLGKLSPKGTPTNALVFSSIFITFLMIMNFTKGLVELFTFVILLATLTCLVPYVFTAMAELMIFIKDREKFSGQKLMGSSIIAIFAFIYSIWAIIGSGQETVYWGFVLLMCGIPIYVWIKWRQPATNGPN